MKRKIIKQGHDTLTLTLPREWVKKLNLMPRDELEVIENGPTLIINGRGNNKEKFAVIDIRNFTIPTLWRYFQSAYRSGCTEIKILFDPSKKDYEDAFHYYTTQFEYANLGEKVPDKPAISMLQGLVSRFIGFEIIETGRDYCVVKEMGEPSEKDLEGSLRRSFLVILELFDRTIAAIAKNEIGDPSICKELHTIDLNTDRFIDYCARILNKKVSSIPEEKKQLIFSSLFILELVGDEFKYIGKHLAFSKKSVKECLNIGQLVKEYFETYYKLYYKFDRVLAIEMGKKDYEIYKSHFTIKNNMKGESRSILRHFMMISKMVLGLFELRIQKEF